MKLNNEYPDVNVEFKKCKTGFKWVFIYREDSIKFKWGFTTTQLNPIKEDMPKINQIAKDLKTLAKRILGK